MEKIDKILDFIEKENLSPGEYQTLNQLTGSEAETKYLLKTYKSLKSGLPGSVHIDIDLLSSYILYEKGIKADDNLAVLLSGKIKSHLKSCSSCREEYNFLSENYSDVKLHIDNTLMQEEQSEKGIAEHQPSIIWRKFSNYRYAFASVISVIIIYIGLLAVSSVTTPFYNKGLFSDRSDDIYRTRGRTSLIFQKGLDALDKGNTATAVEYFNEDIEQYGQEKSIFYTHYILGIIYLKEAESSFLGLFNSFDKEKVNLAIKNFQLSIDKNTSGNYNNLKLDAYYYLGRSYLLTNDFDTAEKYFNIVINEKGRFYNEASEMIDSIKKN